MENTNQKGGNSQVTQVSNGFDWKNKNLWLGVAAVLVIVLLIVILSKRGNKEEEIPLDTVAEEGGVVTEDTSVKPASRRTPATKQTTSTTTATTKKITYAEALIKYNDFRLQFDPECRAVPNNVTYKNGTEIMIDNRSNANRKFVVGSTFTVAPYDFKIVKVSSNVLPYTYLVDCGDRQNVATILLQR